MNKCLGRIAVKASPKALMFANYIPKDLKIPKASNYWTKKTGFTDEAWGNDKEGCCTIAKQANMFRRFQRVEHRKTIEIAESEVHRVYRNLVKTKYQSDEDTGAYEDDALSMSRSKETCLRDTQGRPLTIDAYTRLSAKNHQELKTAIYLAKGHGIAICINLPLYFSTIAPGDPWVIPENAPLTGDLQPGSWGGHSMWAIDYGPKGILLEQTWRMPETWLSWEAASAYLDEAHSIVDSVDSWSKTIFDTDKLVEDVNNVSSTKIAA